MKKKRPYVVACAVLALDLQRIAESLGLDLGARYLPAGLHENPDILRQKLQGAIDHVVECVDGFRDDVQGFGRFNPGILSRRNRTTPGEHQEREQQSHHCFLQATS